MDKNVYLVRHCSTTGQEPNAPLTDAGFVQAEAFAAWLSGFTIERIVSSVYTRAIQSAEPLARVLGLPIVKEQRLVERVLSTGSLDDIPGAISATLSDLDLRLQGGETSREAMKRAVSALEDILQHPARSTVFFAHGNLLTLLLKHFDPSVDYSIQRQLTNPDVYRLIYIAGEQSIGRMLPDTPFSS